MPSSSSRSGTSSYYYTSSTTSGSSRGSREHEYISPHSSSGRASMTHRGGVTVHNHGVGIREPDAPSPKHREKSSSGKRSSKH